MKKVVVLFIGFILLFNFTVSAGVSDLVDDARDRLKEEGEEFIEGETNFEFMDNGLSYDFGLGDFSLTDSGLDYNIGIGDFKVGTEGDEWSIGFWDKNTGIGFTNEGLNSYWKGDAFNAGYNPNGLQYSFNPNDNNDISFSVDQNGLRTGYTATGIDNVDNNIKFDCSGSNCQWRTKLSPDTNLGEYNFGYAPSTGWDLSEGSEHRELKTGAFVQKLCHDCKQEKNYLGKAKDSLPEDSTEARENYQQRINSKNSECEEVCQTRDRLSTQAQDQQLTEETARQEVNNMLDSIDDN